MKENKARAELAKTFLAALQEDQIPWRKCWDGQQISFSTGKPYRGMNSLILAYIAEEKGYQDPRWMTYKQAQDHGWQVRKGEKSARVQFWHYYDTQAKKVLDQKEFERIQRDEPERMKDLRLSAYTYSVFNVEQIAGEIPPSSEKKVAVDVAQLAALRQQFLANLGVSFGEGGERAYYSPALDHIQMPSANRFLSDSEYLSTLLHEAGHATGHPSRLNRDTHGGFGSDDYAKEELRAEIASAFTAQALGLARNEEEFAFEVENHKAYIQSWAAVLAKDPNELFAAIKDAEKITDYLLEHGKLLELSAAAAAERGFSFEYRLLDRLKTDCNYFLGAGGHQEKHLWAGNVKEQIAKMRELYDLLPAKPDWLTSEDIDRYEELMTTEQQDGCKEVSRVTPELEADEELEL